MTPGARKVLDDVLKHITCGWVQGTHAVDAQGEPVAARSPSAVRWCLEGALACAAPLNGSRYTTPFDMSGIEAHMALRATLIKMGEGHANLMNYNDSPRHGQADVIRLVERTLKDDPQVLR